MVRNLVSVLVSILLVSCHSPIDRIYQAVTEKYSVCIDVALETARRCYEKGYHDIWIIVGPPSFESKYFHANIRINGHWIPISNISVPFPVFEFKYIYHTRFIIKPGHYLLSSPKGNTEIWLTEKDGDWFVTSVRGVHIVRVFKQLSHRICRSATLPCFLIRKLERKDREK